MSWFETFWWESSDTQNLWANTINQWSDNTEAKNVAYKANAERVQEQQTKSKKVQWQIKQSKKNNQSIALFLSYLLKNLPNDTILILVYDLFLVHKKWEQLVKDFKNIHFAVVLIAIFAPFYVDKIEEYWFSKLFDNYNDWQSSTNITYYVRYLVWVLKKYETVSFEDQKKFISLLSQISVEFSIVQIDTSDTQAESKLYQTLYTEIYW